MDPKAEYEFAKWWAEHGWPSVEPRPVLIRAAFEEGWNLGQGEKFVDILKRCDFEVEEVKT